LCRLTLEQEKAESLVTLPEPSSVMKSLLNFCYAPSPRNTYVDPIIDVNDPTYALAHHAALYWAADKYIIDELKDWAFSYLDDFLSVTNNDLIADLNPSHDEDDHSETTKRWKTKFFDLCKAVDTLLECTADDDEIRRALENIEWGRFALKNLPEGLGGACGEISGLCC